MTTMTMTMVTEDNFNQEVLASSEPVFVHFQAPWCSICRLISPILSSFHAEWQDKGFGELRVLEINADENFKLANQYQLTTLPTLLYIGNGEVIQRIEGFEGREIFRAYLDNIAYRHQLENTFVSHSA